MLLLPRVAGIILSLAFAFCIFGVTISRLFRWRWILRQGPGLCAMVGLAGSTLFLEAWNFFYPVSHVSVVVFAIFALGLALIFWRTVLETIRAWSPYRSPLLIVSLLSLLALVSLFGLGSAEHGHYDTGLYYLHSIRWAQQYPVVPGLANLHFRLAFNQSLFLFIAFLSRVGNLGLARACQIVNPLFVLVSGWAILDRIRLNLVAPKAKRVRLYAILLLCPLFFIGMHNDVSAPTADLAAAVYALPAALAFCCCLEEAFEHNGLEAGNWLLVLAVCYATLVKLKLSYFVLAAAGLGIAGAALIFVLPRSFFRGWIRTGVVCFFLTIPWMVRGTILSGYPFFPATFIRFRTDWAFPRRSAESEVRWICSWARVPDKDPSEILNDDRWLKPWIERNAKDTRNTFPACFIAAGLVFALLSFLIPINRKRRLMLVLLVPQILVALIFWFKTAPDPRFGYATLLLLGVNPIYWFIGAIAELSMFRAILTAGLITLVSFLHIWTTQFRQMSGGPKKFPHGFSQAELEFKTTNSGLRIGVPKNIQPWDSGLLVTPYFNPYLALRGRDLRDGFHVVNTDP